MVWPARGKSPSWVAFGSAHREGDNEEGERFVTVLEIPPVEDAVTAVRASIMADAKKRKK